MKVLYDVCTYFISVLDCVYSNHMTDGIKVESRIIRYSQIGLLEKHSHIMYNKYGTLDPFESPLLMHLSHLKNNNNITVTKTNYFTCNMLPRLYVYTLLLH